MEHQFTASFFYMCRVWVRAQRAFTPSCIEAHRKCGELLIFIHWFSQPKIGAKSSLQGFPVSGKLGFVFQKD